jgi:peptidoglycan/LPS O-acetylase OafA/YrhL
VNPTRPGTLLAIAVICAAIAWLTVHQTFATLPPLPWTAVPAMLLLAGGEALAGRNLKARISGRRTGKPLQPIAVARMAALAKASSAAAAALGGLAAGFGIYVAGQLEKQVPRADAWAAAATVLSAAALVAAALYLERSCRAPRPPEDRDSPSGDRQADWR